MDSIPRPPTSTRAATRLGLVLLSSAALTLFGCGSKGDDQSTTGAGPEAGASETTAVASPGAGDAVIDPGDGGDYHPEVDPARFSSVVDNPYLPLRPGSRWRYESVNENGDLEVTDVEVLDERRTVVGVETVVVHDVLRIDDEVIEDTFDWYAQDAEGNVWYFGEDTTSYHGGVADTAGSWEAGVGGALPGIVMPVGPQVSDLGYRQEFWAGEAEDMGQVIAVSGSVTVPAGTFDDTIRTRDWTPLEPDIVEEKVYARDVGLVYEIKVDTGETGELIEYVVR